MVPPHCTNCRTCSTVLVLGTSSGVPVAGFGDTGAVCLTVGTAGAALDAVCATLAEAAGKGRQHTVMVTPAIAAPARPGLIRCCERWCMTPPPATTAAWVMGGPCGGA